MSIAAEIESLVAAKQAIKAAIQNMNPTVPPTDDLAQWPDAIASIPTGGGSPAIDWRQVQWIQGTGTQYVNTGLKFGPGVKITCRFALTEVVENELNYVFWATQNRQGCGIYLTKQGKWTVASTGYSTIDGVMPDTEWHEIEIYCQPGNQYVKLDGAWLHVGAVASPTTFTIAPVYLMWTGSSSAVPGRCKIATFRAEAIESGVALIELVPFALGLADGSDVGYMFDMVSGEVFGNVGTGTFAVGPDAER